MNRQRTFNQIWCVISVLFLLLIAQGTLCEAQITAASCSQEDVQAAIDSAGDGDVVIIPAGTATWTTLVANMPAVIIDGKAITLQGAGMDSTVIIDSTGDEWNESLIRVNGEEGKPFRITGFQFNNINDSHGIRVYGTCKKWRIDHCRIYSTNVDYRPITVTNESFGVIDHCDILGQILVSVTQDASGPWSRPFTLGTDKAIYVEDCTFDVPDGYFTNTIDGHMGSRYVFRYNYVRNSYQEAHGLQGDYPQNRGTVSYEIYNNTMEGGPDNWYPFAVRGGSGVIFNNTLSGTYALGINIYTDRVREDVYVDNPDYLCDGDNPIDGNEDSSGYPCRDQIGRVMDLDNGKQFMDPLYEWNNFHDGSNNINIIPNSGLVSIYPNMLNQLKENRDFYNDTQRPGYQPYTYPHPLTQQWPPPAQTDFIAPTVPQHVTVERITENTVEITWDASTDTGGSGLAGYYIWVDGKKVSSNSDPDYQEYVVRGLIPGERYTFAVSAFDGAGNESTAVNAQSVSYMLWTR